MNMSPKLRPIWQRVLIIGGLFFLMAWKACRLPTAILPRAFASLVNNWSYPMLWELISSFVSRGYIDQPCNYQMPASCEPRADVDPQHRLTPDQIQQFHENGYLGPFDAFPPEQMQEFRKRLVEVQHTNSQAYDFVTPRDRHFEMPDLMELMISPAITDRAAQLLGPDLICWRSQIFYKEAGTPMIQWHQASTFLVEDYLDPALYPPNRDELFQLTIWVAVDRAHKGNGCMRFMRGGHDKICKASFGRGNGAFYHASFDLEFDEDPDRVEYVECQPGQFIMFTERCVHGSAANDSTEDRLAFNFRVIPTNIPVYPNKEKYRSVYNGGKYYLNNWGNVVIRGEDRHQLSRTIDVNTLLPPGRELRRAA